MVMVFEMNVSLKWLLYVSGCSLFNLVIKIQILVCLFLYLYLNLFSLRRQYTKTVFSQFNCKLNEFLRKSFACILCESKIFSYAFHAIGNQMG